MPYGHTLSHVTRALAVSEELRRRGHRIVFAGDGRELQHPARRGYEVRQLLEMPYEILFGRIRNRSLRFVKPEELQALVDADLAMIDEVKPKLVLSDGRISARLSTRARGIPHAAIVNVSSTHHRKEPYVPILKHFPESTMGAGLRFLNLWLEMQIFDLAVPAFSIVARRIRLTAPVRATNCLEGNDLTLLPDLPEFMPSRGLPMGHHYVGPLLPKMDVPNPPWWNELKALKQRGYRILYVTLGSTGAVEVLNNLPLFHPHNGPSQNTMRLYEKSPGLIGSGISGLNAKTEEPWVVVMSTGGQPVSLPTPERVFVARYLDADRVLEMADLVLCHGGNGTIYQALSHGVPILGIPAIPDQAYNMRRVEALGIGHKVKISELKSWTYLSAVARKRSSEQRRKLADRAAQERKVSASKASNLVEKLLLA